MKKRLRQRSVKMRRIYVVQFFTVPIMGGKKRWWDHYNYSSLKKAERALLVFRQGNPTISSRITIYVSLWELS